MPSTQTTKSAPSKRAPRKTAVPAAEPKEAAPPEPTTSDAGTREVMIRIAAYSFYERRGFVTGHELEDWLQAEMEVDRQLAEAQKKTPPAKRSR